MSQSCKQELEEAAASARRWKIVAVVFIVLGVALGAIVAIMIWRERRIVKKLNERTCSDFTNCMLENDCQLTKAKMDKAKAGLEYAQKVGEELGSLAGTFKGEVRGVDEAAGAIGRTTITSPQKGRSQKPSSSQSSLVDDPSFARARAKRQTRSMYGN